MLHIKTTDTVLHSLQTLEVISVVFFNQFPPFSKDNLLVRVNINFLGGDMDVVRWWDGS